MKEFVNVDNRQSVFINNFHFTGVNVGQAKRKKKLK